MTIETHYRTRSIQHHISISFDGSAYYTETQASAFYKDDMSALELYVAPAITGHGLTVEESLQSLYDALRATYDHGEHAMQVAAGAI